MIHQVAAGFAGPVSDMRIYTEWVLRLQERLVEMLSRWTGQPPERIAKDMEREFFMTAEEARAYGIVDALLEPYEKEWKATP
jgi:ATP-dependent Clp protease protease subunit